ncbi:hypothetical protein Leryth_025520, partial [Lithospermum erythrorhizon]
GQFSKFDENRRAEYFLKDSIPNLWAIAGYVVLAIMSVIIVPLIFGHRIRWYAFLLLLIAPIDGVTLWENLIWSSIIGIRLRPWWHHSLILLWCDEHCLNSFDLMQDFKADS